MTLTGKLKSAVKLRLLKLLKLNILDSYVEQAPSAQTALDVFKGEWVSQMPAEFAELRAGTVPLFDDGRIKWLIEKLESVTDSKILELGPLEGGHTYSLVKAGADVLAVEANQRAFLKCLIAKEIFELNNAKFVCGDFIEFLRRSNRRFDLCVASGVLYHMKNPLELLSLVAAVSDKLFLWTHYYDEKIAAARPHIAAKFSKHFETDFNNIKHRLHRYEYGAAALSSASFCGGGAEYSHWLEREQILQSLQQLGFADLEVAFENPDHENGASFAVLATRGK